MWKKLSLIVILMVVFINLSFTSARTLSQQSVAKAQSNSCIACHSTTLTPTELGNRFFQWHFSAHSEKGVSCDQCHGGNPSAIGKEKSHEGILPPGDLKSRLNQWNLPETCGTCHQPIVKSFVTSTHYQKLKVSETGPSCTACHSHMARGVIYSPGALANLCASCHSTIDGVAPTRLDIPQRAKAVMETLQRTDYMVSWANLLLEKARERKLQVKPEQQEMTLVNDSLKAAQNQWHTFELESVGEKFDLIFLKAKSLKERLTRKLD
jgi:nitrate/TMAO reductase-like tetraheme cytochrome c subunit